MGDYISLLWYPQAKPAASMFSSSSFLPYSYMALFKTPVFLCALSKFISKISIWKLWGSVREI